MPVTEEPRPDAAEASRPTQAPELLAPAGDWLCARAAVENGADAVYFGLATATCFNARARAKNFTPEELPGLLAMLHRRGVKGYAAINTLVFPRELDEVERLLRRIVEAGADAAIVQDLGVARLARALCPGLPLHASTQMTLSSAEAIRMVEPLGIRRVILPRELSIREIRQVRAGTGVELEVFVHGALCLAYSGQCLASLTLGGRSGNRGECAQPCRMPYQVVCDGNDLDLGGQEYPLSTRDLAAYDLVPELIQAGVAAFKIEGRLKAPEYVAAVTRHYRRALDAALLGGPPTKTPLSRFGRGAGGEGEDTHSRRSPECTQHDLDQLAVAFSRGFCHGWLEGPDHKALVSGQTPAAQGILLGTVKAVRGDRVVVRLASGVARGDGVVFEGGGADGCRQGGRVYEVFVKGRSIEEPVAAGEVELTFGRGAIDWSKVRPGQEVRKTDDPRWEREVRRTFQGTRPRRRVALDLVVEATVGRPLCVSGRTASGGVCRAESPGPLEEARKHPLTEEMLQQQLGRLGNSAYELRHVEARIEGRPMVPLSVLGQIRRAMVEQLDAGSGQTTTRAVAAGSPLARLRTGALERPLTAEDVATGGGCTSGEQSPQWHVLCRSEEQIEAVLDCGARSVIVDLDDLQQSRRAVEIARDSDAEVLLATPRIQKPGEERVFRALADLKPDGLLVRNLGGLGFCRDEGILAVADFPLNAANELSWHWLRQQGASRVTAAYDLDREQLLDLTSAILPEWLEVVVYRHTPMFHTGHCIFCRTLSSGTDRSNCGRPCRQHGLRLRDRKGEEHFVAAESGCRNTVYSATPHDAAGLVPAAMSRGVRHFRMEFLPWAAPDEVRSVLERLHGQPNASP